MNLFYLNSLHGMVIFYNSKAPAVTIFVNCQVNITDLASHFENLLNF